MQSPLPGKHMVFKTITRRDFYSVLYRSDGSLYPQVQVHAFEGRPHSSDPWADLKVYSYVRYSVLVDALSTNIQGFEKPSWSKNQSLRRKSPHTCHLFKA